MENLGKQMLEFRGTHNPRLSRAKFAEMCGVTAQTVYNIETGRCVPSMAVEASIRKVIDGGGVLEISKGYEIDDSDFLVRWLSNGTTDIL